MFDYTTSINSILLEANLPSFLFQPTLEKNEIIESIQPELLYKHPLNNTWTLWYFENDKKRSWEENQREITSFETVEDFWRLVKWNELFQEFIFNFVSLFYQIKIY